MFDLDCFDLRCKEDHVLEISWIDLAVEVRREQEEGWVAAVRERAGMGWTDRHQGAGSGVDSGRT